MFPWPAPPSSLHTLLDNFHSRKLLLLYSTTHLDHPYSTGAPNSPVTGTGTWAHRKTLDSTARNSFDENNVMILAFLLCALISALGLNWMVRCVLWCSRQVRRERAANDRLANSGVKKKALKTFPTLVYSPGLNLPRLDLQCAICLSEFAQGDRMRVLPGCSHGFHLKCIDKWLISHSSCPTCRQCLLDTCQKIAGRTGEGSSDPPQRNIVPLDREGLLINYRTAAN